MREALRRVDVIRVNGAATEHAADVAAVEEPLEVRLDGEAFAVIMRTPGADVDLVAGFLLAEGVIRSADELGAIKYCRETTADGRENTIDATLLGDAIARRSAMLAERRQVVTNSACGMCGRLHIESVLAAVPRIEVRASVPGNVIRSLPDRLRTRQAGFDETGGLHGAALFTLSGEVELSAEDVGRHNAVDKVIGRMLIEERLPLSSSILFVSGRTSFEIVQKAALAGIPIVGAVSAPSSLAIDLAIEAGITLAGFVRDGRFNIYSHPARVDPV